MVVLFGWSYYFTPTKPLEDTANTAANTSTTATPVQGTPIPAAPAAPQDSAALIPDETPNRLITIKSPLYEVTLDSKGALATSWILLKSKSPKGEYAIYGDGSTDTDKKP